MKYRDLRDFIGQLERQRELVRLAGAFPPVRRAMNHTLREYLSLGM